LGPDHVRGLVSDSTPWTYSVSSMTNFWVACPAGDPDERLGTTGGRRLATADLALHETFFSEVGLDRFEHADAFSPFHHEIFAVVADETAATVTLEDVLWPRFRFGDLQFCRAGVRIRAPAHLIEATAATTSTLYFTHRREPRRTADLSHGWGSNSQWRTRFTPLLRGRRRLALQLGR